MRRATALAAILLCLALLAPFVLITQSLLQAAAPNAQETSSQSLEVTVISYPANKEPGSGGGGGTH